MKMHTATPTNRDGGAANKIGRLPYKTSFDEIDTSHPKVAAAVQAAKNFLANIKNPKAPSLLLTGPHGTGKTTIARILQWNGGIVCPPIEREIPPFEISPNATKEERIEAARFHREAFERMELEQPLWDLSRARPIAEFLHADRFLNDFMDDSGDNSIVELYRRLDFRSRGVPFVIVDDIGAEGKMKYVKYELYDTERQARYYKLFNYAAELGYPIVITTNLAPFETELARAYMRNELLKTPFPNLLENELKSYLGAKNWDRIMEICPAGYIASLWGVPSKRIEIGGRA